MRLTYDTEADAAYIYLRPMPATGVDHTVALDTDRMVDYAGDEPVGVELLNVSLGVNLDGLPRSVEVEDLLRDQLGMRRADRYLLPANQSTSAEPASGHGLGAPAAR